MHYSYCAVPVSLVDRSFSFRKRRSFNHIVFLMFDDSDYERVTLKLRL